MKRSTCPDVSDQDAYASTAKWGRQLPGSLPDLVARCADFRELEQQGFSLFHDLVRVRGEFVIIAAVSV